MVRKTIRRVKDAFSRKSVGEGLPKIPRSQRILLPVCHRPGHGCQVLQPAEGGHFLIEFNTGTKVAARTQLSKIFPHLRYNDIHVYPEFIVDGQRYQPAIIDWPMFDAWVSWEKFESLGWSFVPIDTHPEAVLLKAKINHSEDTPEILCESAVAE